MMFMVIRIMLSRMMRMMIIMFMVMQLMIMNMVMMMMMMMMMMPIFQCSSCGSASDHIWGVGFSCACLEGILIYFIWMISYTISGGYPHIFLLDGTYPPIFQLKDILYFIWIA